MKVIENIPLVAIFFAKKLFFFVIIQTFHSTQINIITESITINHITPH